MDIGMPYLLEMQDLEECCALARELGLAFVELNANFPACQMTGLDPVRLHRLAGQYGLYFTLHVEEECDPFTFNPAVRRAWLQTFAQALSLAEALEMPIINMHFPHGVYLTLPHGKTYLYDRYAEEFHTALREFRDLCDQRLQGTATRIGIENTNGWKPHEQQAIAFLLESPVFGLTLDIGHCHGAEKVDEPFFRAHEDRLIHMHGHDARGKQDHLPLGTGEIDLRERFAWAKRCGSRIVLETKTIQALRESVVRLEEFLP